jgi:hypothetical protein
MPASAVIGGFTNDSFQSRGGVVGPWWTGSGAGAMPSAPNGGFWFGTPGLGFGGSQGSTSGMNTFAPTVTTMPGATGIVSDSRLVPFVTGVVPVVGSGYSATPMTTAAVLPASHVIPSTIPARVPAVGAPSHLAPPPPGTSQTSSPGARDRAKQLVAVGDRHLTAVGNREASAKAALAEYRSAVRFIRDDPDIEIRQAMLYEALGNRRDADRAIARATTIDGRLTRPLENVPDEAAGFFTAPSPGLPAIAARGFAILDEITAGVARAASPEAARERPVAVVWLAEAWARRWGTTGASVMLDAP